jgi:hypothetical protein
MQYLGLLNLAGIVALFVGTHALAQHLERRHGAVSTREALVGCGRIVVDTLRWVGRGSANLPPVDRRDDDHGPMRQLNSHRLKLPD